MLLHEWYLIVIHLEGAIYNIDTVFCLFYLCFIDANAMGFFGLWCISRASSTSVCFDIVCFCFPWLRRVMSVLFGSVYIFDNPPLGLLSYVFPSCYFGPGWLCTVVFLCIFSYARDCALLLPCSLLLPCVFAGCLPLVLICELWAYVSWLV
jgi:hypothetical protein